MGWFRKMPKHLPTSTGPYTPGCVDVMLDYSRNGIFMRLYYPTNVDKNNQNNYRKWTNWIPDDSYIIGLSRVIMVFTFLLRMIMWWSGIKLFPALYGEKPKTDQKMPCVILSHGLGGHRFLYTNVCCELASRGFLVLALEHREHSASNTYYYESQENAKIDRRTIIDHRVIKFGKDHYRKRNDQIIERSKECSKAIDFLINLNKGIVPNNILNDVPNYRKIDFDLNDLVDHLDVDTMTMAGHSFGGGTALYTLSKRKELKQGILLDPWMFCIKNDNLEEKIPQPLLFINTQTFHIESNVKCMEKFLNQDNRKMYTIRHTTHENQTDSALLIGYWLNWFMKKLNPLTALKINNSLMLTFLNETIHFPDNVQDCEEILKEEKEDIEYGLTKPWA